MQKRIPYGVSNYEEIIQENYYFVDKTAYIAKLERVKNPVFLRPRRFGKSLFCSMLRYYYDINEASRFAALFGQTWIGQHPTGQQNQAMILALDFSSLEVGATGPEIVYHFKQYCNTILDSLRIEYPHLLKDLPAISLDDSVSSNLGKLLSYIRVRRLPPLYFLRLFSKP